MKFKLSKDNIIFYTLILILLFGIYYVINIFSYFSPTSLCYISLNRDVLSGNKKTMHQAIALLKKEDKEVYRDLCKYVEVVSEKYCYVYDDRVEKLDYEAWQPGCYVKGSKTIYIKPEAGDSEDIIRKRAEDIKKYLQFSKEFWGRRK